MPSVGSRTLALAAFLFAAACGGEGPGPGAEAAPAPVGPPGLYFVERGLYGVPGRARVELSVPPVAPLAGWLTPAAVPSPDGRYLAYNAWDELREDDPRLSWADQGIEPGDALAVPSLRLLDLATGEDRVLEPGAFSAAWGRGGELAYFKGSAREYRAGVRYLGHVVVRPSPAAAPVRWTEVPGRYVVVAWAGERLLAYHMSEGEQIDTLVLEGPGRARVLAERGALVAVGPEGRRAFLERGPADGRPAVTVLDVADGRELARLELADVHPAVGTVGYAGDWKGERVVASAAGGLAVFRVGPAGISVEHVVRLDAATFPSGAAEPRFADETGRRVVAWADTADGPLFLDCRLPASTCASLRPAPAATGAGGRPPWRRPAYDPSRPEVAP